MSRYILWGKITLIFSPVTALVLLLMAAPSFAAWPDGDNKIALDRAPIADIKAAAAGCGEDEKPVINFTSNRNGLSSWPGQYIQISWNIKTLNGGDWNHDVYLRLGEVVSPGKPVGEAVTPLWTRNIKASLLREGLQKYYLVTRCAVAGINIGLVPKPVITNSPGTIFKGDVITISGRNFMEYSPEYILRVIIAEAGLDRPIKVLEWSEDEITALATFDTGYGRHKLVVDIGINSNSNSIMRRRSVGKEIAVVKRDLFPPVMIQSAIKNVFSDMKIRLNTYGPSPEGSWLAEGDSYIEPSTAMAAGGAERTALDIPEYSLTPVATEGAEASKTEGGLLYYINDINMYIIKVLTGSNRFKMTFFSRISTTSSSAGLLAKMLSRLRPYSSITSAWSFHSYSKRWTGLLRLNSSLLRQKGISVARAVTATTEKPIYVNSSTQSTKRIF